MTSSAQTLQGTRPDFSNNAPEWMSQFSLPDEIEEQAAALLKGAEPRFSRISWSETLPDGRTVAFTLDGQPDGRVRRLEDDGDYKIQKVTIGNAVSLLTAVDLTTAPLILQLFKTNLSFPLRQGQRYRVQTAMAGKTSNWLNMSDSQYDVTGHGDARELNPALSGQYWRVECGHDDNSGSKSVSVWLEDLQVFMPLESVQDGNTQRFVWHNLSITR